MRRKTDLHDIIIGINIKAMRKSKGYTLERMGKVLGITLQQFSKYECGIDRISAANLYKVANYFKVDIQTFFKIKGD